MYSRLDNWNPGGMHLDHPRLSLDLRFNALGDIGGADILKWRGGVAWARRTDRLNDEPSTIADSLRYRLDATVLGFRGSVVTANLYANRTDFQFDGPSTTAGVLNGTDEALGGTLSLNLPSFPSVEAGYDHQRTTGEIPGLPDHESQRDLLTAAVNHGNEAFALRVRYRGEWSDGTWVSDQQRNYSLISSGQSQIGTDSRVYLSDAYYERTPTSAGPGAFAINSHAFQGGYMASSQRGERTLSRYAYNRTGSTLNASTLDSISQSLRFEREQLLSGAESRSWLRYLVDGTLTEQRSGITSLKSGGETVGLQLWHYEKGEGAFWELGAGPLAGLLQVPGESDRYGYGASGSAQFDRGWSVNRVSLAYSVDYGNDLFGLRGWTLRQRVAAGLAGPALKNGRFSTHLSVTANRGWNPVLGDDSSRTIQADGSLSVKPYTFEGSLGLSSGILGNSSRDLLGDGILLPTGFDTHTTYGRLAAVANLPWGLVSRLQVMVTDSSVPGQPVFRSAEGLAALSYRYAAFDLSIENRFTLTERADDVARSNLVLFTVSRTVGTRF
jgi:hypothetical protein